MRNSIGSWIEPDANQAGWSTDTRPVWRTRLLFVAFLLPFSLIALRLVLLQVYLPPRFTEIFEQTSVVMEEIPTRDGRILSRDGTILAYDRERQDLQVHYRWLEQTPNPDWLKTMARSKLSRTERRSSKKLAQQMADIEATRQALHLQLAKLVGLTPKELRERYAQIEKRVTALREHVARHRARPVVTPEPAIDSAHFIARLWNRVANELTSPPERSAELVLAEEVSFHTVITGLPTEIAREIAAQPELYPGTRVVVETERVYPQRTLAAHILGARTPLRHDELPATPDVSVSLKPGDRLGRTGIEQTYDQQLRGVRGLKKLVQNRRGETISAEIIREAREGEDIVLSLDADLQTEAERLLDSVLVDPVEVDTTENQAADASVAATQPPNGGAIVAIDISSGEVLVAASAPRFDANLLVRSSQAEWDKANSDPRRPFFVRATQMAIPPGSTFKALTAIAAIESGVDPQEPIHCLGYLDQPNKHRCLTFRHYGVGHGETRMADALCRSCNVYFFTAARKIGPENLTTWAQRMGFGSKTGIDFPQEDPGLVPTPAAGKHWPTGETLGLSIGQASLKVTPLQMARFMALVANGGEQITPRLVMAHGPAQILGKTETDVQGLWSSDRIAGLHPETLEAVRHGLELVVSDPRGTGYKTVRNDVISIAGKTGTAETGGGRPDHAWFVGYAPADHPKVAFAVVLEDGGSGGKVAGPIAKELAIAIQNRLKGVRNLFSALPPK